VHPGGEVNRTSEYAAEHSVHLTVDSGAFFGSFLALSFSVSTGSLFFHPPQVTQSVGRLLVEQGILIVREYVMLEIGAIVWGVRDLDQAKEVERLLNLGATRVDWKYDDEVDYVVLADPDGNTFCVVQVQS
jgi:hypothetical protein